MDGHITNDIGRVIPLHKGEYSATASYELNDCVSFHGSTYWHYKPEATVGILPTDETVWRLMVDGGDVERYVERALQAAEYAEGARDAAQEAKTAAEAAETNAENSANDAEESAESAAEYLNEMGTLYEAKQDKISDLDSIRSGAEAGATAVQPEAGKGLFSGSYNDLTNKPTSVDGLNGGTIESNVTIKADEGRDYPLTLQSNADDNGGAYEGGAYLGFRDKIGNVLGYFGVDRDKEAVFNKGGKDYKLGIQNCIRARRMFAGQGSIKLPFGSVAFTLSHDMTITWREYSGKSDPTGVRHTITTAGPCIMYLTKIGNSGVKNEGPLASGLIGYVTGELLNPYSNSSFLTRENNGFQISGTGMLYYISPEDLGTDK